MSDWLVTDDDDDDDDEGECFRCTGEKKSSWLTKMQMKSDVMS